MPNYEMVNKLIYKLFDAAHFFFFNSILVPFKVIVIFPLVLMTYFNKYSDGVCKDEGSYVGNTTF